MNQKPRVAPYLRVSTDGQTTENQRLALKQVAKLNGWHLTKPYDDSAVSGAKRGQDRAAFKKLLDDGLAGHFDVVAVWSLDRLGRDTYDVLGNIKRLHDMGIGIYLHQEKLDTTSPYGMMALTCLLAVYELERKHKINQIHLGLQRAKKQGKETGRPRVPEDVKDAVRGLYNDGNSIRQIASKGILYQLPSGKKRKLGHGTIQNIVKGV